jgi:hypothetical protein
MESPLLRGGDFRFLGRDRGKPMHDSTECPVCRGQAIDGSMTDDEFDVFLQTCEAELADKQAQFQERIRDAGRWSYDLDVCTLTIGAERFPIIPIGSHSPERQTWLWAWANEDNPAAARDSSRRFQDLHRITGFRVFLDPGIPASSADSQAFSAMAIHHAGAIALFKVPTEGPVLYFAVLSPDES